MLALTEKVLLNVEQLYVSENDEPNVKTNGSGKRMEMSGSEKYMLERMKLEIEFKKAEMEMKRLERCGGDDFRDDSVDKKVSFVPDFVGNKAEDFFLQFEKVAELKGWPEEEWALLVQIKLKGRARESHNGLTVEECRDYALVKETVLSTVRVDPEVYRQKFREARKSYNGTYLEMARECTITLEKWLKSENIRSMEDMKQVILLEHFKNNVRHNMQF